MHCPVHALIHFIFPFVCFIFTYYFHINHSTIRRAVVYSRTRYPLQLSIVNYVHLSSPYHHATWSSSLAHWPTPIGNRRWQQRTLAMVTNNLLLLMAWWTSLQTNLLILCVNAILYYLFRRILSFLYFNLIAFVTPDDYLFLLLAVPLLDSSRHRWIRCLACFLFLFLFCS